ncbi:hypothetical protein [Streptomyces sp. NPDC058653]|uniref:DUF6841 family protein n=1 Tax=Streptomyces sp. NPDC058653 TaxID=3346576 RepID=UPI003648BD74
MNSESHNGELARTAEEARVWFFDEYFPAWVGIAKNSSADPRSVLDYWTPPLHISSDDPDPARARHDWCLDPDAVLGFLSVHQAPLKAAGYTHTEVPDSQVTAYSSRAAGVDAIWSRRTADDSEIERLAVHFELRRDSSDTWHIIAITGRPTGAERLSDTRVVITS